MSQAYMRKQSVCMTCRNEHIDDTEVAGHKEKGHTVEVIVVGGYNRPIVQAKKEVEEAPHWQDETNE